MAPDKGSKILYNGPSGCDHCTMVCTKPVMWFLYHGWYLCGVSQSDWNDSPIIYLTGNEDSNTGIRTNCVHYISVQCIIFPLFSLGYQQYSFWTMVKYNMILFQTKMHSSTTRSSSHLLGGGVSVSVHAGIPPHRCVPGNPLGVDLVTPSHPQVWAWRSPPPVWAWRPLQARTLNFPLECGPGNLQCMLGYHPHPPVNRILATRFWKYYLVPTSLRVVINFLKS